MPLTATNPSQIASGFGTSVMDRINLYFRVRRYMKMLARRWFILVICAVVAVGYAVHHAFSLPNIYRAGSKISLPVRVIVPAGQRAEATVDINSYYETHMEIMQSSKVITRADEKMKATYRQYAGLDLKRDLRPSHGIGFFTLMVDSTDFDYARLYSIVWAKEFLNFMDERNHSAISDSINDTRKAEEGYKQKLDAARLRLQEFQRSNNIASVKETADAAQQRLDNLLDEHFRLQTLRQRLAAKTSQELLKGGGVEGLGKSSTPSKTDGQGNDKSGKTPPSMADLTDFNADAHYAELGLKLRNLEEDCKRYQVTLKPKHPFMASLLSDIEKIKLEIKFQEDIVEEKRLARIKSLQSDEDSYLPLIADAKQLVFSSRGVQNEWERLKSEENDAKSDLDNCRIQLRQLDASNIRDNRLILMDEGTLGDRNPVSPDRRRIILAGLFIGLGLGLAIIYLLDRLDDRLELAEDIEAELEQAVLGQLPLIKRRDEEGPLMITRMEEHSMFAESLRVVRSAVMLGVEGGKKQVQLVTSAVPGDGKTTFTTNFAITLAIAGHKVLLVDADLRRGNIHKCFGLEREGGLAEVLAGEVNWADVIKDTDVPTLKLLSMGRIPGNPGELLIGDITRQFLEEAKREFDYIVFDCPPLTAIDDTFALVGMADGILFVVRAGQTSMRFAKNAIIAIHQRGARLFGVVLNGITADNPYYYYNHYYHGYYRKGRSTTKMDAKSLPGVQMPKPKGRVNGEAAVPAAEAAEPQETSEPQ